ncbi:MAG: CvpA family protein [Rikenellaceae bacterium]
MNIIDIIILICLAISIVLGFKDGAIRQLGSLVGIILAIILAKAFGTQASELLGIGGDYPHIWGFAIVLIVALLAANVVTSMLTKIIRTVGLGIIDRLAGALLSAIKCALILSVLFSLFNIANESFKIVSASTLDGSMLYEPIVSTSDYILPTIEWIGDQIPSIEQS